jgi:hypothetical protein
VPSLPRRRWATVGAPAAAAGELLTSKANAQELRAFELGPYVRRRYDALLDERMARLSDLVRARLRRSLWASVAGSALTAATFAVLVALPSGHLSPEAAVPAAVGAQQHRTGLGPEPSTPADPRFAAAAGRILGQSTPGGRRPRAR